MNVYLVLYNSVFFHIDVNTCKGILIMSCDIFYVIRCRSKHVFRLDYFSYICMYMHTRGMELQMTSCFCHRIFFSNKSGLFRIKKCVKLKNQYIYQKYILMVTWLRLCFVSVLLKKYQNCKVVYFSKKQMLFCQTNATEDCCISLNGRNFIKSIILLLFVSISSIT